VHYGIQYYTLQQQMAAQYGFLHQQRKKIYQKVFNIKQPKLLFALK
jgi:DNA polymerase III delta subunit